jgi:hypothetical protein
MSTKEFLAIAGAAIAIGLVMIGAQRYRAWRDRRSLRVERRR